MEKDKKENRLNLKIESQDIDPGALFITRRLNDSGYEALVVGGCIRNLIMGEKAHDWDITTSASADEIFRIFKEFKVIPVGKKFGTVSVVVKQVNYEVSTFKKNKSAIASSLVEDLGHRDFTINAFAWSETEGVIDYFNGLGGIKERVIRGVEDPIERIKEDPLRMLRAVRLACELDFKIEKATLSAIKKNSSKIKKVSPERVRDEFTKILLSNDSKRGFKLLYRLGLLRFVIPELQKFAGVYRENSYGEEDLLGRSLDIVTNLPPNLNLRLSALLYNIGSIMHLDEKKNIAVKILQRLKFKNQVIKKVNILTKENWLVLNFSKKINIRRLASRIGIENLEDAWELKKAFIKENPNTERFRLAEIERAENNISETLKEGPPVSFKDLTIKGKDLIELLGYQEGKEIGEILKKLLKIVTENPELNKKKILLELAKNQKSSC
ncbi:MAG TPA: polynucleotide adenylyltransferase [Candidatus Atribacteria bacterium]|nr:polynucleotide adenylyltransferase [Candidatus Atribacteria bacterium]